MKNYNVERGVAIMADGNHDQWYPTLKTLKEYAEKLGVRTFTFKAKELNLNGNILTNMAGLGFIRIDHQEECWYRVDDETMKKGRINVYEFDYAEIPDNIFERIRDEKVNKVERRIECLKAQLAKAYEALEEI